jgi:hypothetical protein
VIITQITVAITVIAVIIPPMPEFAITPIVVTLVVQVAITVVAVIITPITVAPPIQRGPPSSRRPLFRL